jgi:hypothetical protein
MLQSNRKPAVAEGAGAAQRHVVAVDQRGAARIAQDRLDLAALWPADGARLARYSASGPAPACPVRAPRIATGSPRPNCPSTPVTPAGSSDLPGQRRARAPASTGDLARGFIAAIQRLRAACGSPCAREPRRGRAVFQRLAAGCSTAPFGDRHGAARRVAVRAAISLVFIPPLDRPEPASPAIASISGVIVDHVEAPCRAVGSVRRVGGIEPVHIRQQHQLIGPRGHRDLRRQPVIVAIADLVGGHGVVFVHDGHHAQGQQRSSVAREFR